MKVSLLKIRSFIFIFLFLLGTALTIPLHRKIVSRAEEMVKGLSSNLYEKTGLYFNYENLSPSILSKIFVKNIIFYDGEDNTIRFAYPKDPNFIVDVKDITGWERRFDDEISIVYLKDWERRLKKRELAMNETLKEFNEREKNYKARIEYLESQIEELNDKLKDNKEIIWHLINNCNNKTKIY